MYSEAKFNFWYVDLCPLYIERSIIPVLCPYHCITPHTIIIYMHAWTESL